GVDVYQCGVSLFFPSPPTIHAHLDRWRSVYVPRGRPQNVRRSSPISRLLASSVPSYGLSLSRYVQAVWPSHVDSKCNARDRRNIVGLRQLFHFTPAWSCICRGFAIPAISLDGLPRAAGCDTSLVQRACIYGSIGRSA